MKFEVRSRRGGAVNLMFLDDQGNVVLDVDGLPNDVADDLGKLIRRAAKRAREGIEAAATLSNEKPE